MGLQVAPGATWNAIHNESSAASALIHTMQFGSTTAADAASQQLNTYLVQQGWSAPWFRPKSIFVTGSDTNAVMQIDNAYPYLWNVTPES